MKRLIYFLLFVTNLVYAYQIAPSTGYKYTAVSTQGILVANDPSQWKYIDLSKILKPIQPGATISLKSIAYGNNTFVVVGYYGLTAYSNDEIQWSTNYIPNFSDTELTSVIFYHGKFYANSSTNIYSSTDGSTWVNEASTTFINKLAVANDKLYAVGNSKLITLGGFGWMTVYEDPTKTVSFNTIAYGNNIYIVNSRDGTSTLTSVDGMNWIEHIAKLGSGPEGQTSIYTDKFIVLKYFSKLQDNSHYGSLSQDGLNWTFDSMTVNNGQGNYGWVYFIAYDNSVYFAGGGDLNPSILLSYDGIKWYTANLPADHGYNYSFDFAIAK